MTYKPRLALVDDDPLFCDYVVSNLSKFTSMSKCFRTLESCLEDLKREPGYDFILVDRYLEHEDAVADRFPEACRYLGFSGKIILLSSSVCNSNKHSFTAAGFDKTVDKANIGDWQELLLI